MRGSTAAAEFGCAGQKELIYILVERETITTVSF